MRGNLSPSLAAPTTKVIIIPQRMERVKQVRYPASIREKMISAPSNPINKAPTRHPTQFKNRVRTNFSHPSLEE